MSNPFDQSNESNGALSNGEWLNLLNHLAVVDITMRSPEQSPTSRLNSAMPMLRAPPREEPEEIATTSFSSYCNSVLNQLIQQHYRDEDIRNSTMQTLQTLTREEAAAESRTTTLSSYCNVLRDRLTPQRHRDEEICRIHHDLDPHMFLRRFNHQSGLDASVRRLQLRLQRELGITPIGRNDIIGHVSLNDLGFRMECLNESVNVQSARRQYILGSVPAHISPPHQPFADRARLDVPVSTCPLFSTSAAAKSEPVGADKDRASPRRRMQVSSRNTLTTESLLTQTGSRDRILHPVPWTQRPSAFEAVKPRAAQARSLQLSTKPSTGVMAADIPFETTSNTSVAAGNDDDGREMPRRKKRKYEHESFPQKLHRSITELEALDRNGIVSFLPGTQGGFQVHQPELFVTQVMPGYFRCTTWASFRRQLASYGFPFQRDGNSADKVFRNPLFIRGRPDLCAHIQRDSNKQDRITEATTRSNQKGPNDVKVHVKRKS